MKKYDTGCQKIMCHVLGDDFVLLDRWRSTENVAAKLTFTLHVKITFFIAFNSTYYKNQKFQRSHGSQFNVLLEKYFNILIIFELVPLIMCLDFAVRCLKIALL